MAERDLDAMSVAARIEAASAPARGLLWVITRASEAVTERLIERVWSGEPLNLEVLRKVAAELAGLPEALRAQVEAQLPAEVLDQIAILGDRPTEPSLLRAAPLLAELTSLGLIAREGEGDDAPFGAPPEVVEQITAFIDRHPEERGERTEPQIFQALGERYAGAFEALASAAASWNERAEEAQELTVETGRRAIRYLVRAGVDDLGAIAGRMVATAGDAELRLRLLTELTRAAEEAEGGAPRRGGRSAVAALAAATAEATAGDEGSMERALSLYERAIDEAEEVGDEASFREATALCQRWAEALERAGQGAAARDAFRRSAANARRAKATRPDVIAIELEVVRLGIRHGGDIGAVQEALGRHIDELQVLQGAVKLGEGAAEVQAHDRVAEVLAKALELAVQLELASERWQAALDRLDQTEALLEATSAGDHARAVARCLRYVPLSRLHRLDEAEQVLSSTLAVFRATSDIPAEVGTLSRLADLWDERGDAPRAVAAAREALAKSEELSSAEMRAGCHENLSTYLEKAGDPEGAREHQVADLVYRLVARLDVSRALRTLNLDVLRAVARRERHALPRLTAILEKPEFAAVRRFLEERGVPEASLEEGIDRLVETVQAGTRGSSPGA
jgi:tetratricopeptide (TPR) repeat protein